MSNDSTGIRCAHTDCDARWQAGDPGDDYWNSVAFGRSDTSSIFLAGDTTGLFNTETVGMNDLAAARLDTDGDVTWKYQVRVVIANSKHTKNVVVFFPISFTEVCATFDGVAIRPRRYSQF